MKTKEDGFNVIEFSLIILVIGIIGFIGWRVSHSNNLSSGSSSASISHLKPVAQDSIKTKSDLQKAANTLNTVKQQNSQTNSDVSKLSQTAGH